MTSPRRIACFILSCLLASSCTLLFPGTPERTVRVRILADPKLREENSNWLDGVRETVKAASDYFDQEFGIRLVIVNISPWPQEDRIDSTARLLRRLKEQVPLKGPDGSYDLIIALTGEWVNVYHARARVDRIGNCQEGLGNYIVSSVSEPLRYQGRIAEPTYDVVALIHELGHIFGAEHVQDIGSIMNEDFDFRTEFDDNNRETILKNKFCPFGKGG
jgi:hypothetical protein